MSPITKFPAPISRVGTRSIRQGVVHSHSLNHQETLRDVHPELPKIARPSLALRDVFYVLLTPDGRVRANPDSVLHPGLPDRQAALQATHQKSGVFSTLSTRDAGDIRLFTVPIMRGAHVVALLQAGHSLSTLAAARRGAARCSSSWRWARPRSLRPRSAACY